MERYVCIHGHFYQPPRENPWLEAVEVQDGAHPYHDWNEKITDECYAPNATSRILDDKNRIVEIVNNYETINFDIGPTLLSWLEGSAPETYAAVLEADRLGAARRSGHGPAMAQAYNHMIMPLANLRDKRTQIIWGLRDFEFRFKRPSEGIWLPETAVDIETLDIAASMGVKFTVLAPHQAKRVRRIGSGDWRVVSDGSINTKRAYKLNLPSGRSISIFFYEKSVSHAVAFERLLDSGAEFAKRLAGVFSDAKESELMHIATDGESYGHHHRFGDMALAFAIRHIESKGMAKATNYGEFLERQPPTHEVEISENTSWSCGHGVERWRADCGCNTGAHAGWNQKWRGPLRQSLDRLRDGLSKKYEEAGAALFKDPWEARDGYIDIVLDRSRDSMERFFEKYGSKKLSDTEEVTAVRLLEMERHLMLMYTSCGWFFDDISGIEAVQVLQYAGRAIQLARELFGESAEEEFLRGLSAAKSNDQKMKDGAAIFEKFIKPALTDLQKVGAHYAVSSLFKEYPERAKIYCYGIETLDYKKTVSGRTQFISGKCRVSSDITRESDVVHFSVLHLGNHDFNCGVHTFAEEQDYESVTNEMLSAFQRGASADIVRLMDSHFRANYSLKDLFKDEQRKILYMLLSETIQGFESAYRKMYEENHVLMAYLMENGIPVPRAFYTAADFILNLDLKRQLKGEIDGERISKILDEAKEWNASLDEAELEYVLRRSLLERMRALEKTGAEMASLEKMETAIDAARLLPFSANLWELQNIYYRMAKNLASRAKGEAEWEKSFRSLGEKLYFNLDSVLKT